MKKPKVLYEAFSVQDVEGAIASTGRTMQPKQLVGMLKQLLGSVGQNSPMNPATLQTMARQAATQAGIAQGDLDTSQAQDAEVPGSAQDDLGFPEAGGGLVPGDAGGVENYLNQYSSPEAPGVQVPTAAADMGSAMATGETQPPGAELDPAEVDFLRNKTLADREATLAPYAMDQGAGPAPAPTFPGNLASQPRPATAPEQQASDAGLEKQMQARAQGQPLQYAPGADGAPQGFMPKLKSFFGK